MLYILLSLLTDVKMYLAIFWEILMHILANFCAENYLMILLLGKIKRKNQINLGLPNIELRWIQGVTVFMDFACTITLEC